MLATLFTWESCNPLFVICDRGVPACPLSLCVKPFFRDQTSSPGIYNVSTTPHRKASGLEMSCWKQPIMLRTLCIALSRLAGKHMKAACSYATFKVHLRACLHTHLDRFLVTKSINEAKGEMQLVSCRVVIYSTLAADFIVYFCVLSSLYRGSRKKHDSPDSFQLTQGHDCALRCLTDRDFFQVIVFHTSLQPLECI